MYRERERARVSEAVQCRERERGNVWVLERRSVCVCLEVCVEMDGRTDRQADRLTLQGKRKWIPFVWRSKHCSTEH